MCWISNAQLFLEKFIFEKKFTHASVRTIFLSFKSLEITPGTTSQCIWNKACDAHVIAVLWKQLFKSTPILMMIWWRKGLMAWIFFCSLRNIGSWSKRRYFVTIASAACWSISDYNIDPQRDIATQKSYFQNILRLTMIYWGQKDNKTHNTYFQKRLGTYYDH